MIIEISRKTKQLNLMPNYHRAILHRKSLINLMTTVVSLKIEP